MAWQAFRFRSFMGVAPFLNQMFGCELYSVRSSTSVWPCQLTPLLVRLGTLLSDNLSIVTALASLATTITGPRCGQHRSCLGHEAYTHSHWFILLWPGPFAFATSKVAIPLSRPGSQPCISATGGTGYPHLVKVLVACESNVDRFAKDIAQDQRVTRKVYDLLCTPYLSAFHLPPAVPQSYA